jgi:hypothetical protein
MVNGLAVLGWGVGGIEAEAAMLGQPIAMLIPEVIGFKLTASCREGVTATDLVLTVTQMLRKKGVVGKFVEFYGPGLAEMTLADRATIGNMAPEYGATCGFFPVDEDHGLPAPLGRTEERVALVENTMPRPRACGDENTCRTRSSPTRWNSTSATSCPRWPARSARRTAWLLTRRRSSSRPWRPAPSAAGDEADCACRWTAPITTSAMATW